MSIPVGQYGVIYADPPWAYSMYSEKGHAKSPYAHYDCMSMEELKGMRDDILFSAAPDCVLFM
ncbi:MAG: DNA methyltransferase, partial [Alphaproteobacteria bacterium]|nr:DNA methyltransferase [Alphaproteobacteria bacterium]